MFLLILMSLFSVVDSSNTFFKPSDGIAGLSLDLGKCQMRLRKKIDSYSHLVISRIYTWCRLLRLLIFASISTGETLT